MKLIFAASPLRMHHERERAKTDWFGIRIMCPSVYPRIIVSVSQHNDNPPTRVGLVERGQPHYFIRYNLFNLSSPSVFIGVRIARSLIFCVVVCRSLVVLSFLFFLAIAFSIHLRFTASDQRFGIFNLFLAKIQVYLLNYNVKQQILNQTVGEIHRFYFCQFCQ